MIAQRIVNVRVHDHLRAAHHKKWLRSFQRHEEILQIKHGPTNRAVFDSCLSILKEAFDRPRRFVPGTTPRGAVS
jgi:hypothetical protein